MFEDEVGEVGQGPWRSLWGVWLLDQKQWDNTEEF